MKQYSSKKSIQLLAHHLDALGVHHFVISPGSRNAPIAIHFTQIENFHCYSIVDERSAAFVAMGMARQLGKPVGVICTSGSAAVNYYPAVTEAFYQNIPLLLLTADRPTDFVDLFDGQTIRQKNIFHQHSYGDFELKEDGDFEAEESNAEILTKAISLCVEKQGPVHINIPLEEPLYEFVTEIKKFRIPEAMIAQSQYVLPSKLATEWNAAKKILILTGTLKDNAELQMLLAQIVKNHSAVVLTEVNSNLHDDKFFNHIDRYIFNFSEEDYRAYAPDLLITVGQNVVSKKVKQFLRKAQPTQHWHIDKHWHPDTYFALTERVKAAPEVFFQQLLSVARLEPHSYFNLWTNLKDKADHRHTQFLPKVPFSDFLAMSYLSKAIPQDYHVHFSNSSVIRYAQLFDFKHTIHCNRGTSGIDGSTSTAMGYAMVSDSPTVLITGDIGFFYDINGLWNQYIPPYTRIILLNNGGGDIFKIIPGPSQAMALNEFIATTHHKSAEALAKHFGFEFTQASDDITLSRILSKFFENSARPKILEINTQNVDNASVLKQYFREVSPKNE